MKLKIKISLEINKIFKKKKEIKAIYKVIMKASNNNL